MARSFTQLSTFRVLSQGFFVYFLFLFFKVKSTRANQVTLKNLNIVLLMLSSIPAAVLENVFLKFEREIGLIIVNDG